MFGTGAFQSKHAITIALGVQEIIIPNTIASSVLIRSPVKCSKTNRQPNVILPRHATKVELDPRCPQPTGRIRTSFAREVKA